MPDKQTYEYAVIRVVPKVERGEFVNVGVILLCKRKKYLDLRFQIDAQRLRAFSKEIDLDEIERHLEAWATIARGGPKAGEFAERDQAERFRWLTAAKSTILQCSEVHPGLCLEPEAVLDQLFDKLVKQD